MAEDTQLDDELLSAAELKRLTGAAASTFTNWIRRDPPLAAVTLRNGDVRFRRSDVLAFCEANLHLGATRKVQRALRAPTKPPPRSAADNTGTAPDVEALKALARDIRNAAHQNLQAVLTAARHAEETARAHREQLEQLAKSIAAYDAALSQLTAPHTMND